MAKSPVPPGAFVELNAGNIDEGKFFKQLNAKIKRAYRELIDYEKSSEDTQGKAVITAQISIFRTKGTKDHFSIVHGTKISTPAQKNVSVVKARGEHLLCQPTGASEFDPDQMVIFDAQGRAIGGVDPETGEVVSNDVAGKIEPQAKAQ